MIYFVSNETIDLNNRICPGAHAFNSEVVTLIWTSHVSAGHNPEPTILTLKI